MQMIMSPVSACVLCVYIRPNTTSLARYMATSVNSPNDPGGRHKGQTGKLANGVDFPLRLPSRKHSFRALRSHFVSLPLDSRLQFLLWLFEGALLHCISDSSPTSYEAGHVCCWDANQTSWNPCWVCEISYMVQ
ncbi:hypothetical protein, variant 2 [Blastomyces dermatitidis ER-3]|uniref:Uncharacterized protein n=2 Tax=Ajellomyces dermatitidis TaxID=5039 RepID=F2TIC7_AJEDA|nr:uncharacterized protein BDCG_06824 [Blastomyces dermatitidis ER-3]XP_045281846.1 hypothetical protein, variant 1 [Blastomyces dermatitidis ER-3]XP_045281847.1 hypothetical protein, variant 2 [Blastomyces dermatitidis ER-3]EGE82990.2 hypothetical protein BDDG_05934 [Blastomyces dermatitidis ATCC 18188]KMW67961.1 hypothetical protein, variant [Blastomyces dermatitidis ATCC 18188]OAT02118.1 hypothetical protein BDCG_06824 [Blastomyces dermatitidis ER-3]OAT02119.1 hypothetical protein, variant